MKNNYSKFEKFLMSFFGLMMSMVCFSQSCPGNAITLSIENLTVTPTTIEYDVYISNTGSTNLLFAMLQGSIIYDANLLNPAAAGVLSVVTEPTNTGNFSLLGPIASIQNQPETRQLRWTQNPVTPWPITTGNVVILPNNTPLLYVRFKFTSSMVWVPGTHTLEFCTINAPGYTKNLAVAYCNGNIVSTAFESDNNNIAFVNRTFTITPEMLSTASQQNYQTIVFARPNPFSSNFNLNVQTDSNEIIGVKVYDMTGKLLEKWELKPLDVAQHEFGTTLSSGVYNVIVTQGDSLQNLRLIKR
jgi:hypothetical protein